eukprot:12566532-Ditylum_brightwellii.AAC.1
MGMIPPRNQKKQRNVMGKNNDGLLLWHHTIEKVSPSTKVMLANLKDNIRRAMLDNFDHNIKKFNLWFKGKRTMIVIENRKARHTKYIQCLFKTYLTLTDTAKFLRGIKDEQKKWMLDNQSTTYAYNDLIDLDLKLYNNQQVFDKWNPTMSKATKPEDTYVGNY